MYSQNKEEEILLNYFSNGAGTLLSIGENDGKSLSNSLALIENGWSAVLVEPAPQPFSSLCALHFHRDNVYCLNVAVSDFIGEADFYDSGTHLNKGDYSLLSSLKKSEIEKWKSTTAFRKIKVDVVNFKTMLNLSPYKIFDFVTVDAEGNDLCILKQMDLKKLKCRCICIEYNGDENILNEIISYCSRYGLKKELLRNAENIILAI